jgi:hypothetical protein
MDDLWSPITQGTSESPEFYRHSTRGTEIQEVSSYLWVRRIDMGRLFAELLINLNLLLYLNNKRIEVHSPNKKMNNDKIKSNKIELAETGWLQ